MPMRKATTAALIQTMMIELSLAPLGKAIMKSVTVLQDLKVYTRRAGKHFPTGVKPRTCPSKSEYACSSMLDYDPDSSNYRGMAELAKVQLTNAFMRDGAAD